MLQMPQLVGMLNAFGGLAAVFEGHEGAADATRYEKRTKYIYIYLRPKNKQFNKFSKKHELNQ